jgi:hypothetical protein
MRVKKEMRVKTEMRRTVRSEQCSEQWTV